ncbi:MAG: DNA (cytosine-5-)-methyltransferase [Fusobacteriaceae bacterium]
MDVLTAGFPCQAFSIAGGRKGFSDHRGELFYSILELVKQLEEVGHGKPRVLFLENVKNLARHDEGRTFKVITSEIEKIGYSVKHYKIFNTYEYTELPQNRERIFIICFRDKEDEINFGSMEDIPKLNRTKEELKQEVASVLDYDLNKKDNIDLYYTDEKYPNYFQKFGDVDKEKRINLNEQMTEMYEVYQIRRGMYVRKNQSGVCPTLTANMGTGGHNVPLIKMEDGIRKLSPKDCFNLQGFRVDKDFILPPQMKNAPLYKQAGNAVSVDMVELLARKILNTLKIRDNIKSEKNLDKFLDKVETKDEIITKLEKEILKLSQSKDSYSFSEKNRIVEVIQKLFSEATKE